MCVFSAPQNQHDDDKFSGHDDYDAVGARADEGSVRREAAGAEAAWAPAGDVASQSVTDRR